MIGQTVGQLLSCHNPLALFIGVIVRAFGQGIFSPRAVIGVNA